MQNDYILPKYPHEIDHLVLSEPRLHNLREWLLKTIPSQAQDDGTRKALRSRSINDLLLTYLNWVDRQISPRKRQVTVWDGFWKHGDPHAFATEIDAIIQASHHGDDLSPWLSQRAFTSGFSSRADQKKGVNWADKDAALNAFDVHHLHLTPTTTKGKRRGNSDKLLFVSVRREEMLLLMLGDHKSFDDGSLLTAVAEYRATSDFVLKGVADVSRERTAQENSLLTRHGVGSIAMVGDKAVSTSLISCSGHALDHRIRADQWCEVIESFERVISDTDALAVELNIDRSEFSLNPNWSWRFWYGDLFLFDDMGCVAYLLMRWRR